MIKHQTLVSTPTLCHHRVVVVRSERVSKQMETETKIESGA